MTIVDFVEARLAEDERIALATSGTAAEREWTYAGGKVSGADEIAGLHAETWFPPDGVHIAHHHPARVLRQCAAIRAAMGTIRLQHYDWRGQLDQPSYETDLAPIAAIWSDHPDFREEWAL